MRHHPSLFGEFIQALSLVVLIAGALMFSHRYAIRRWWREVSR